jgi:hypothetical protein
MGNTPFTGAMAAQLSLSMLRSVASGPVLLSILVLSTPLLCQTQRPGAQI